MLMMAGGIWAYLGGDFGAWLGLVCVVLGMVAGVPVGTPMPTLEGLLLAACLHWSSGWLAPCGLYVQGVAGICLLIWLTTFVALAVSLIHDLWFDQYTFYARWCQWDYLSFVELPAGLRRWLTRTDK